MQPQHKRLLGAAPTGVAAAVAAHEHIEGAVAVGVDDGGARARDGERRAARGEGALSVCAEVARRDSERV